MARHYSYTVNVPTKVTDPKHPLFDQFAPEPRSGSGSIEEVKSRLESAYPDIDAAGDPDTLEHGESLDLLSGGNKVGTLTHLAQPEFDRDDDRHPDRQRRR